MKINEICIERKFNLGNYEMLTLKVSVSPSEHEQFKGLVWVTGLLDRRLKQSFSELMKEQGK